MREKDYSEQTAVLIDNEVRSIVDGCYARARDLITEHQDKLRTWPTLLEKEVLESDEIRQLVGLPVQEPATNDQPKTDEGPAT